MLGLDGVEKLLRSAESSNVPLPDIAKRQLRVVISSVRNDISLLDSTALHSSRFVSLHHEKSALLMRLNAAISPIKDLPQEIIAEIISSCVSSTVHLAALGPNESPWNLTQICSVWRHIALTTPSLWNDITVQFPCHQECESAHLRGMLEIFLSRAGNLPISLDISAAMFYDYNPFCSPFIDSIIDIVRPHVGRLQSLELQPPWVFMPLLELPGGVVRALESVTLVFAKEDGDSPPFFGHGDGLTSNITAFEAAPDLRSVYLISQYADMHLNAFRLPWAQLTHLTILETYVDFADGHEVLRQCTSLISCSIGVATDDFCVPTISPTILRNLESLTVHAYDEEGTHGRFLEPFILPCLRHLELTSENNAPWSEMNVAPLIRRSSPAKLESFHSTAMTPRDVSAVLAEVPLLKELSICFLGREPDRSLDALVTAIARGDLVPNVQKLDLDLQDTYTWGRQPPKPCITIQCHPGEMRQGIWDSCSKLRTQGIEIIFHTNG